MSMDIAQKLRSEGLKVTPQRIAIYHMVYSQNTHPTAEMIYQSLREEHPSLSLATVYKTMELFEKIGIVRVLDMGDSMSRYDWDTRNHPHIRCSVCNRVDDLHGIHMESITEQVTTMSEYHVVSQQLAFEGICPQCLKEQSH